MAKKRKHELPKRRIVAAAKKRRHKWPKMKFHLTGKKLTVAELHAYPMKLTDDLFDFLRWRNGGVPELDSFVMEFNGEPNTVARVQRFNGVQIGDDDNVSDLAVTTLNFWHDLPRGSIPIGEVDTGDEQFNPVTLLTFLWGERVNKVYFFDNPHDCDPLDPDDESRLTLLAKSLPQFIKSLKSHEDFRFREVFRLPGDSGSFSALRDALEKAGVAPFEQFQSEEGAPISHYADWNKYKARVYLTSGTREILGVPLPKGLSHDASYLAIDVFKWNRVAVLAVLKKILGRLPEWKGAKLAGRTPAET